MDFLKYKMNLPNGIPSEALHLELSRLQIELQRRDALIEEQQKRIFQLEDELKRCNKQVQELVVQLANYKEQKPKTTDVNYKPPQSRYWTAEEHDRFIEAVKRYGPKDVKAIAQFVGTRNPTQVRTHAQKYYLRLERERKRREDGDTGPSDNLPSPDTESDIKSESPPETENPASESANVPSTSTSSDTTSVGSNERPPESNGDQPPPKKTRKRAASSGRRSSLPVDLNSSASSLPREPDTIPSSSVVHSTRQQLHSAAPIISAVKGWTAQEYDLFIEGLLSFPDEKDINKKCKLISERFLPKFSPEDIKQCYAVLHNYIRNKESNDQDTAKRLKALEGMSGLSIPTYTTTAMPPTSGEVSPVTLRYNIPRGYPYQYSPSAMPISMYGEPFPYGSPYSQPDPNLVAARRASYPLDAFSVTKAIPANEYQSPANPSQNTTMSGSTEFPTEHLFPAEYPTWSNAETHTSNPQPPTTATVAPSSNEQTTTTSITESNGNNPQPSNN